MSSLVRPVVDAGTIAGPLPEIPAGDLVLRRWTAKDGQQLVDAFRDGEIRAWHLQELESQDEAVEWINAWKSRWRRRRGASWAISRTEDRGTVLGQVGFRSLFLADGLAECSYWVVPEARRQGIATLATRTLSDWALDTLGLERLELLHSTRNEPSCRVALRAGFEAEGTKRRLQQHLDGWHDMHLHARVRSTERGAARLVPAAGLKEPV